MSGDLEGVKKYLQALDGGAALRKVRWRAASFEVESGVFFRRTLRGMRVVPPVTACHAIVERAHD